MKYIDGIAKTAYNVLKTYMEITEDKPQESWEEIPKWKRSGIISDVEKFIEKPELTMRSIHESNLKSKREKGWKYGEKISVSKKEDPDVLEYDELPIERRIYLSLYETVIKTMIEI